MRRLKILYIMPFVPAPEGPNEVTRMYHLLRTMSRRNDVTVLVFGFPGENDVLTSHFGAALQGVHIVPYRWLEKYPRISQFYALMMGRSYYKRMQRTLDILLFENDYDLIQASYPVMGMFQFNTDAVKVLDYHPAPRPSLVQSLYQITGPLQTVSDRNGRRMISRQKIAWCSRFDAVFVPQEREKKILDRKLHGIETYVIPSGIEIVSRPSSTVGEEPYSLFLAGNAKNSADVAEISRFLDQMFPIIRRAFPEVTLYISDAGLPKKLRRRLPANVRFVFGNDERERALLRASVVIFPLQGQNDVKGLILEAMAAGKPVVTAQSLCDEIEAAVGSGVVRESHPERFANTVIELLRNNTLRRNIGTAGYAFVRSTYDWSVIGDRIHKIYENLVRGRRKEMVEQHFSTPATHAIGMN